MYLAHRQRRAMDKQAQHMEDGLAVTRQFADAATASAQAAQHAAEMARLEQIDVKDVGNLRLRVADPSTVLIAVKIRVEPKPEV